MIEVWLTEYPTVGVECIFRINHKSSIEIALRSKNLPSAQREVTAKLIELGLTPKGRWKSHALSVHRRTFVRKVQT